MNFRKKFNLLKAFIKHENFKIELILFCAVSFFFLLLFVIVTIIYPLAKFILLAIFIELLIFYFLTRITLIAFLILFDKNPHKVRAGDFLSILIPIIITFNPIAPFNDRFLPKEIRFDVKEYSSIHYNDNIPSKYLKFEVDSKHVSFDSTNDGEYTVKFVPLNREHVLGVFYKRCENDTKQFRIEKENFNKQSNKSYIFHRKHIYNKNDVKKHIFFTTPVDIKTGQEKSLVILLKTDFVSFTKSDIENYDEFIKTTLKDMISTDNLKIDFLNQNIVNKFNKEYYSVFPNIHVRQNLGKIAEKTRSTVILYSIYKRDFSDPERKIVNINFHLDEGIGTNLNTHSLGFGKSTIFTRDDIHNFLLNATPSLNSYISAVDTYKRNKFGASLVKTREFLNKIFLFKPDTLLIEPEDWQSGLNLACAIRDAAHGDKQFITYSNDVFKSAFNLATNEKNYESYDEFVSSILDDIDEENLNAQDLVNLENLSTLFIGNNEDHLSNIVKENIIVKITNVSNSVINKLDKIDPVINDMLPNLMRAKINVDRQYNNFFWEKVINGEISLYNELYFETCIILQTDKAFSQLSALKNGILNIQSYKEQLDQYLNEQGEELSNAWRKYTRFQ